MRYVYINDRLLKRLATMKKEGKKAAIAAEKVTRYIRQVSGRHETAVPLHPKNHLAPTRHGELRIKNCIKFDLGGGYRLVTKKEKECLYLLHVGSHDECHRWIENNRELDEQTIRQCSRKIASRNPPTKERQSAGADDNALCATDGKNESIDDKLLRVVFSGLIGEKLK